MRDGATEVWFMDELMQEAKRALFRTRMESVLEVLGLSATGLEGWFVSFGASSVDKVEVTINEGLNRVTFGCALPRGMRGVSASTMGAGSGAGGARELLAALEQDWQIRQYRWTAVAGGGGPHRSLTLGGPIPFDAVAKAWESAGMDDATLDVLALMLSGLGASCFEVIEFGRSDVVLWFEPAGVAGEYGRERDAILRIVDAQGAPESQRTLLAGLLDTFGSTYLHGVRVGLRLQNGMLIPGTCVAIRNVPLEVCAMALASGSGAERAGSKFGAIVGITAPADGRADCLALWLAPSDALGVEASLRLGAVATTTIV